MKYGLSRAQSGGFFMMPTEVAEKYLKLATHNQLKVLLKVYSLGAMEVESDAVAESLRLPEAEVADIMDYWASNGFFIKSEAPIKTEEPKKEVKKAVRAEVIKPDRNEVTRRGIECKEIAFLLQEAQKKLGRALKQNEASTIVWLYDDEGITAPLMLMLFAEETANGLFRIGMIERMAMDWIDAGITDVKAAEQYLSDKKRMQDAWLTVERAFGIPHRKPSDKEAAYSVDWIDNMGMSADMLKCAYNRCIDSTGKLSMPYINKVLTSWKSAGVSSVEELKDFESKNEKAAPKSAASYDIDLANQMMYGKDD